MLAHIKEKKLIMLIATLMMLMFAFSPIVSGVLLNNVDKTTTGIVFKSPCQQKSSQHQAQKICETYNNLQFYSILPSALNYVLTPAEKIMLLFILGFLAMSPISRIYKPPKFNQLLQI